MEFPDDADGDVLRRMMGSGFDFDKAVTIDFNIDFDHWPLSTEEMNKVTNLYPGASFIDPTEEDIADGFDSGYVQFQVHDKVTYELVINTQETASKKLRGIGGYCESWGVLQE